MTELKRNMLDIWSEVLNVDSVDPSARIMEIGGNSILIYKICMVASERLGIKVSPLDIMMYSSVDALVDHMENGSPTETAVHAAAPARRRNIRRAERKL